MLNLRLLSPRFVLCAALSLSACGTVSQTPTVPAAPLAGTPAPTVPAAQATPQPPADSAEESTQLNETTLFDLLLGEIALQRGDPALAARTYLEAAKRTRDPRVARRAVEVASFARQPELSLDAARTWYALEPDSPQALQVLAAVLVAAKRVDDAQPYLEKLLAADGVNVENGFMQLNRLLAGNPDKSANLRVVRKLASAYPKLAQAKFAIAQAALEAGDADAALASIQEAQSLKPDWEAGTIFEAQVLQRRSPGEAARVLGAYLEKHPGARDARLNYARALVLDKRFTQAREQFQTLLKGNRNNTEVVYAVALLAFQLKDYPVAEENLKRLLELGYRDPNGVRYLLGQLAEQRRQWDKAIDWYKQINDGDHALAARTRTAHAMAKQGRLEQARAYLHHLEVSDPSDHAQLVIAEAQILRDAGRSREALDLLSQALKKDPDEPDLLYDMALTAEKLQRFDLLEANLKELIRVRPNHAHAYNALGYSFAERNIRLPEAKKLIQHALELAPEDYFIVDSLGWVLYREGDLKGAARQLRRAYNGRPDPEIGAHLGEVLWVMGDRSAADRVWQESLEASPDNETLKKTLERFKR
jgi:tetratricopeptide (TPR) repeat protein